jgi:hypothetical protein
LCSSAATTAWACRAASAGSGTPVCRLLNTRDAGFLTEPLRILEKELHSPGSAVALHAARTLRLLGERSPPVWPAMREVCGRARRDEKAVSDPALDLRFSLESAFSP